MSRVKVHIEKLVLRGVDPGDTRALSDGLQNELARVLADPVARASWTQSYRRPLMRIPAIPLETGSAGAGKFGRGLARQIGRGLKP